MQPISRSGHSTWLFTLRMIGTIGGISVPMVGLSACKSGKTGKLLFFWVPSAWTQDRPAGRSKYHSVGEKL
jgi:hypothetical protein